VKLTTLLHLMLRFRTRGAIHRLSHKSSWRGTSSSTGTTLHFTLPLWVTIVISISTLLFCVTDDSCSDTLIKT